MSSSDIHDPDSARKAPLERRRLTIDFSVYYAVQAPEHAQATATLLVLHGFGQSCERFLKIFAPLHERHFLIVAPQAPNQFYVKINPKRVGFTWLTRFERDQSIHDFVGYMNKLLRSVREAHPVSTKDVFLLGFSQGVSMAYRYAVHSQKPVAGVIACGADLPPDVADRLAVTPRFPVMLIHGRRDMLVPIAKAHTAAELLHRHAYPVDTAFFDGGHEIPPEIVHSIGDWIERRMESANSA